MNDSERLPWPIRWGGYLALTLLIILPLSVLMVRTGSWQQGLLLYALACLGATALLALFVLALLLPACARWRPAVRRRALFTLPGTLLLMALVSGGGKHPPIHDVTTDLLHPPGFSDAALRARGEGSNSLDIDPQAIAAQRQAYPDIGTLRSRADIDAAFDLAHQVAGSLGWEIYHEDRDMGIIEAVDTTPIMAFKDDVVIRVRGDAQGSLLDLRSVSRVGVGDLGANAKRVRAFTQAYVAAEAAR